MDDAKEIFSFRSPSIPPFSYITDEILDEFLVALLHALVRRAIKVNVIVQDQDGDTG